MNISTCIICGPPSIFLSFTNTGSGWLESSLSSVTFTPPSLHILPPRNTFKMKKQKCLSHPSIYPSIHPSIHHPLSIQNLINTCPTSFGLLQSVMSYWRISPWSQLLKYKNLSSSEIRQSVIKANNRGNYDKWDI